MSVLTSLSEQSIGLVASTATRLASDARTAVAATGGLGVRGVGKRLRAGVERIGATVGEGADSLTAVSGVILAQSAKELADVVAQLKAADGDLRALHDDLRSTGAAVLRTQETLTCRIETLSEMAARTVSTSTTTLDALLRSTSVDAERLVRQGWTNLGHGYDAEAEDRFVAALVHDNTHALAQGVLGEIAARRGDKVKAEDHLTRSARFAGPDHEVEAKRRLAGYLEGEGRLDDALQQWQVLGRANAGDLFHVAELAARAGKQDLALISAAQSIDADVDMLAAVIGSHDLAALEPERTRRLLAMDSARREAVVTLLDRACEPLERTDRVVAYAEHSTSKAVRDAGGKIADDAMRLRQRGEDILSRTLTEAYPFIEPAMDDAGALITDAGRLSDDAVTRVIGAIQAQVASRDAAMGTNEGGSETRREAVAAAIDELRSAHAATGVAEFARAVETCGSRRQAARGGVPSGAATTRTPSRQESPQAPATSKADDFDVVLVLAVLGVVCWFGILEGGFDRLSVGLRAVVLAAAIVGTIVVATRACWALWRRKRPGPQRRSPTVAYMITAAGVATVTLLVAYLREVWLKLSTGWSLPSTLSVSFTDAWYELWGKWVLAQHPGRFFDYAGDWQRFAPELEADRLFSIHTHLIVAAIVVAASVFLARRLRSSAESRSDP